MVFKTKKEKAQALLDLPSEPDGGVDDLDAWNTDYEAKVKEIEDATVEEDGGEPAPPPPQVDDEDTPPVPTPDKDDIITFNVKRDELPEILRPYKDASEIIKTAAHARTFANKLETDYQSLSTEHKSLKEQTEALQEELKKLKEKPVVPDKPPPVSDVMDELDRSIEKLGLMDETDYLSAKQSKELFGAITGKVKTALAELKETKENLLKEFEGKTAELGSKFEKIETRNKEDATEKQKKALYESLGELQETFPELKLSKPIIDADDCVENDMIKFAQKVLGGLYSNYTPNMAQVSALINAYLKDEPAIKVYCDEHAVTPESIGTSRDDIQKYVIIQNVHERVNGRRVKADGTLEVITNKFTGKPVSFANHIAAYKNLKDESGIAEKELRDMIIEAEKRGQQKIGNALQKKATDAITLGSAGEGSPDDIGQVLTEKQARDILASPSLEFDMQTQAMNGDRTLFNQANKALKRIMGDKYEPFEVDPAWPPENKVAK